MVEHELDFDARYKVAHMPGVAWWLDKWETEWHAPECQGHPDNSGMASDDDFMSGETFYCDGSCEGEGEDIRTGMVLAVMVGDDKRHVIDPDDLEVIPDDSYCPECGQIGCGHYR